MFVSNCVLSTSHNQHQTLQKGEIRTFRVYLKPTVYGTFNWKFTYSNTVDSTWDDGAWSYADKPGGHFSILSAMAGCADKDFNTLSLSPVTWEGKTRRDVTPREVFTCDAVGLTIPPEHYLVFTWQLMAQENECVLPGTPDSQAKCLICDAGAAPNCDLSLFRIPEEDESCVLPDLWDVERDVEASVAFIGDSITQGCQTRENEYEQWASRILLGLPTSIAGRNLGLGFARARDTAKNGAWLQKCKGYDIVHVCLGVNDSGYPPESDDHGGEIIANLRKTVAALHEMNPNGKVVILTVPPFDMEPKREQVRKQVNQAIHADALGADAMFDIASVLSCEAPNVHMAFFGGHPDGRGGAAVAGEYLSHFWPRNRDKLLQKG